METSQEKLSPRAHIFQIQNLLASVRETLTIFTLFPYVIFPAYFSELPTLCSQHLYVFAINFTVSHKTRDIKTRSASITGAIAGFHSHFMFQISDTMVMEASAKKLSKPSELVHKFAKICRLKSLGVFANENPYNLEEREEEKIHPQPQPQTIEEDAVALLMLKLFDTVSTLKLTYIQLQQAHLSYNPKNIQAADHLIVSELKTLYDIKKSYRNVTKPKSTSSLSGPLLEELVRDRLIQLQNLQSQIESKDSEIHSLQQELEEIDCENADLVEVQFRDYTFGNAYEEASKAIHDFAKPLISFMKASNWDLDKAANSIQGSVIYWKRSYKKYAFEAYISRRMFHGFSIQTQNVEDITRFADPFDALVQYPHSEFAKFCRLKYLLVVHSKMELSFFGNLDHRQLVIRGGHPRTMFYRVFVKMAKWVWLLSMIDPEAVIFGVGRGSEFSEDCMESVVQDESHVHAGKRTVGFMVMPGFKAGCGLIKSRVYISK